MAKKETTPVNADRVGIYGDQILDILTKLDKHEDVNKLYGKGNVLKNIAVVADNNDLRIEDAGKEKLTKDEEKRFLEALNEVVATVQ